MNGDPFVVLGLPREAGLTEVRAARRRLALELHPDLGGDSARMQQVNEAFEAAVAHITGRRPLRPDTVQPSDPARSAETDSRTGRRRRPRWAPRSGVEHDMPSFVIEALPAEAYEALVVVASWIGEVLVDEPPYLMDVHLLEPAPCWCRLELVPDAGASTVSLTVASTDGPAPAVEAVRDLWVAQLNALG